MATDNWLGDPDVIEPEGFSSEAAWKECRDYVDRCGGLVHEDGEPNWRAAFGADPGCCSCPGCGADYWAWGKRQRCKRCGMEYPTDWWSMYSSGVQQAKAKARGGEFCGAVTHDRNMGHPFYRYGFEHPVEDAWEQHDKIDWRAVL